jgi:hypothetical protein
LTEIKYYEIIFRMTKLEAKFTAIAVADFASGTMMGLTPDAHYLFPVGLSTSALTDGVRSGVINRELQPGKEARLALTSGVLDKLGGSLTGVGVSLSRPGLFAAAAAVETVSFALKAALRTTVRRRVQQS